MHTLNSNRITNGKTEGNTANHLINESNRSIKNQSPEGNKSIDQESINHMAYVEQKRGG